MKLWMSDEKAPSHRLVRFYGEQHSGYAYLGDLDDEQIKALFKEIKPDLDLHKNLETLKYFGYLNLFVISKTKHA